MEVDDLAALLEQELDLLEGDDGDDDFYVDLTMFGYAMADNEDSKVIDEEMHVLLESANTLSVLSAEQGTPSVPSKVVEEDNDEAAVDLEISNQVRDMIAFEPYSFKEPAELTEEQKIIIADLMELMIASVERCAPILERTELAAFNSTASIPIVCVDLPVIISDELQFSTQATADMTDLLTSLENSQEIGLIDEKMVADSKLRKEEQILAAQQSDQLVWDESKRYKEALEQERVRQEERRLKREQARIAALQEKATENFQRLYRGHIARRAYKRILTARLSELARLEEERLQQQRLQEEALRRQRAQAERECEQKERALMALSERECRDVWAEMKRLDEARRQDELWCMLEEDQHSASIRTAELQENAKKLSYIALAAQEDVEYDLGAYGSDSDCDTISDTDDEAILSQGAFMNTASASAQAVTSSAMPGPLDMSVNSSGGASIKPAPPAAPAPTRTLRAAPSKAKPVVSVDPTQGKKWGGSVSTAWNTVSNEAAPAALTEQAGSDAIATAESSPETVITETEIYAPPPRSAAEQRELEAHWQQLAQQGAQKCAQTITLAPAGVSKAKAVFESLCRGGKGSTANTFAKPAIIQALCHWQACWSEQQKHPPSKPKPKSANTAKSHTATALARDVDNELALQNSMVDLGTDPLLAKELDFCVEGLSSTDFLDQFKNLTKLSINVNKITELTGLQGLCMLLHISAKDNKISSLDALSNLKQLRFLYLDSNKLTDLSPLDGLDQLVVLSANSNSLSEFPCLNCASLQRLELGHNRISSVPAHALLGLPSLNHLNLSSNLLAEASGDALSSCPSLQTLILSENQLSTVPAPLRLPLLKNLRLNLNRITNLDAWGRDGASKVWPFFAPSLQKLVLSDNQISSLVDVFCMLPLLEELDLSFNALTAQEAVMDISHCKLLSALHVQDNVFTTVPVNTGGAAGTSRTALPAPQQAALNQWLCSLCPSLETISGNRLDRNEFTEAHLQRRPGQIASHYNHFGTWLAPDFKIQDQYYQHEPLEVRQLIQLLQSHHHSQNVIAVKERAVKKDEVAASKSNGKRVNSTSAEQAKAPQTAVKNWELELANLLSAQRDKLLRCGREAGSVAIDHVVHVSYMKESSDSVNCNQVAATVPNLVAEEPQAHLLSADFFALTTPPETRSSAEFCTSYDTKEGRLIALSLQKHFRGRRVRKRLGNALQSIRYQDNELDDLFGGEEFNFEQEMLDLTFLEEETPAVMVYGDHIRKRSRPNSSVKAPQAAPSNTHGGVHSAGAAPLQMSLPLLPLPTTNHWVLPADDGNSPPKHAHATAGLLRQSSFNDSRPGTGMTSVSSISAHTDAPDHAATMLSGANSPAASRSALSSRSEGQDHDQISTMSSARRSNKATAAALAQEWGITDPKVLATMIKRNQRTKQFTEAKERMENEKDPQYRLERFQRNAHRAGIGGATATATATSGNTRTSGSFGGAPKTIRGGAGGGAKRKNLTVPAWMLGEGGDGEEG